MSLERTLILVKPDGVQRRLIGRIVSRIEDKCLSIIGMKMLQVTPELSKKHYAEHVTKGFYKDLEAFITSGPGTSRIMLTASVCELFNSELFRIRKCSLLQPKRDCFQSHLRCSKE